MEGHESGDDLEWIKLELESDDIRQMPTGMNQDFVEEKLYYSPLP